jgi:hypothetical protein
MSTEQDEDDVRALIARLEQELLSAQERERLPGLPPRAGRYGAWYQSVRPFPTRCRQCHTPSKANYQRMVVCEYQRSFDAEGRQARRYPGWDMLGWLARYHCVRCGYFLFAPVAAETVATWGRSGWERVEE